MTSQHRSHANSQYAPPLAFAQAPTLPQLVPSVFDTDHESVKPSASQEKSSPVRHLHWLWLLPLFHFGLGGLLSLNVAMAQSTMPMMADKEANDKAAILRMIVDEDANDPYVNAAHHTEGFMPLPQAQVDVPTQKRNGGLVATAESANAFNDDILRLTAQFEEKTITSHHAISPKAPAAHPVMATALKSTHDFVVGGSNQDNELLRAFEDTDANRMAYKVTQKAPSVTSQAENRPEDYFNQTRRESVTSVPKAKKKRAFKLRNPLSHMKVSSHFGPRWGRMHDGTDLAIHHGAPIVSAEAGTVVYSDWKGGYGLLVVVDHGNGITTKYGHCSTALVQKGQRVERGQKIALVGSTGRSTGPHLHFEVRKNGVATNPLAHLHNA